VLIKNLGKVGNFGRVGKEKRGRENCLFGVALSVAFGVVFFSTGDGTGFFAVVFFPPSIADFTTPKPFFVVDEEGADDVSWL
jgi:hypothetical protein